GRPGEAPPGAGPRPPPAGVPGGPVAAVQRRGGRRPGQRAVLAQRPGLPPRAVGRAGRRAGAAAARRPGGDRAAPRRGAEVRGDRGTDGPDGRRGARTVDAGAGEAEPRDGGTAMTPRNSAVQPETVNSQDAELAAALEAYLAAREAGVAVDVDRLAAQRPAVA